MTLSAMLMFGVLWFLSPGRPVGGNATWGTPAGGWTLANYLAGSQQMGPYPAALPAAYDPLGSNPDLPGWKQLLVSNASIFGPIPNRGCDTALALTCVDYESNGGLYPNCDPSVLGFSCALPMSASCLSNRTKPLLGANDAAYNLYNLTFVQNAQHPLNRYQIALNASAAVTFVLSTPLGGSIIPTELVFPVRWSDLKRKVSALPQTAFIQFQINAMLQEGKASGEWQLPDNPRYGVRYSWTLDRGATFQTFLKYTTPGSVTHPDPGNYGNRLYGVSLKLPEWAARPDGKKHMIEIPYYAWALVWNSLPNVDYSFSNSDASDSYCSVQTVPLGPHCMASGPGTQCFVDDLAPGTYCRGANATESDATSLVCFEQTR
jgi:hypothetical protein